METKNNFIQSNTAKLMLIGLLIFILMIPLHFVKNLITERALREESVVSEITEKWGEELLLYGPILKVPYKVHSETEIVNKETGIVQKQIHTYIENAYFFPEQLQNKTDVQCQPLKRNNYETVVFHAKMSINGTYANPDFASEKISDTDILWDQATIIIETNALKSIKNTPLIQINDQEYALKANFSNDKYGNNTLESERLNLTGFPDTSLDFNIQMAYNGSKKIQIVPIGKTTRMEMTSNWPDPSFGGYILPLDNKIVNEKGFTAEWHISQINRPFPQEYFQHLPNLNAYAFDVSLIVLLDEYQKNERTAKYGFLVIALTFLVFFLIQTISKKNIHIFQYTMIGLALIMFYTLLLSITEHSSFNLAYGIATTAVVVMITWYAIAILKEIKFPTFIGLSLTLLYSFIFVIIQLENYALLAGSIGLFAILGAVMYFSRKIDWDAKNE